MEIYRSVQRYGIADEDIVHAVEHALSVGEQDDGKLLYLGPDRAANMLEVVAVARDGGSELVIHAIACAPGTSRSSAGEGDNDA